MFINYLKIALRNIYKNKIYSAINIFGLAFGITCFLLISIYLNNELTYDSFHANSDSIFRILRINKDENGIYKIAATSGPYAESLKNDYPSYIESTTRVMHDKGLIEYKNKTFREDGLFFATPIFLSFLVSL